ncbi:cytochrome P450 6j1 [Monomorium pharaonis]|uniref:cytochrome P450 6j1 n=1 Tax=Monomorium pharaonis TaxID=307658 RepID=UPI00063F8AD5|nr:cytochrome P450 6j1 [Monomorium pharaonis]
MAIVLVLLIFVVLVALYFYLTKNYKYWQKRRIPCPDGIVPGFGHFWDVVMLKSSLSQICHKFYNENRNRSMIGFYNMMTPSLLILESELVKKVLQTSFVNFSENGIEVDPELDPLLANNPFFTTGDEWLTGRKRLTYAFSSMRLKILLETIKQVCEKFESYLDKKLSKTGKAELELKTLFARFTSQVVSSAAFGVDGLCFDEKDKESFYEVGNEFLKPSLWNSIVFNITFFMPWLNKIFKASILPKKADRLFRTMVANVIEKRQKEGIRGNDFLQVMVDLENMNNNKINLDVLTSHAVSFFLDGYETSSSTLSFVAYQLATHPEVQKKLREEIVSVINKHNGVTYEALGEMTYMDQVFKESMRIIPTVGSQNKICTKEIMLRGSDGLICRVEPGTPVLISIMGLHEDPRYWENPKQFDPERFSRDRKHNIEKFAYLAFGEGPRMCVGMRMAELQIKACLAMFLRKYSIELSPKTRLPLRLLSSSFLSYVEGGLWGIIRPL